MGLLCTEDSSDVVRESVDVIKVGGRKLEAEGGIEELSKELVIPNETELEGPVVSSEAKLEVVSSGRAELE